MFGRKARKRRQERRSDRREHRLDKRQQRQDARTGRVEMRQNTKQSAYENKMNPNQWASDVAGSAAGVAGDFFKAKTSMFGAQLGADNNEAAIAAGMNPFAAGSGGAKGNPGGLIGHLGSEAVGGNGGGESMMPLALGALGIYLVTKK